MKEFSDSDFDTEISSGVVIVDFYADWCRPCTLLKPVFKKLSEKITEVKFGAVDVEANPQTTEKLKIASLPTIIIFKDGEKVEKLTGLQSETAIVAAIQKVI